MPRRVRLIGRANFSDAVGKKFDIVVIDYDNKDLVMSNNLKGLVKSAHLDWEAIVVEFYEVL